MNRKEENMPNRPAHAVSITSIVILFITFCAGIFFTLLFKNFLAKEQITLSTQTLLSFVFTVGLGTASIILAFIAITISRKAEEALIRRSDEGIRIQNEVFIKSSEVLSKIQASTGVTERRIEDIISGRTNVIAKEVVERSLPEREAIVTKEIAEKITSDIADSLRNELIPLISSSPSRAEEILVTKEAKQKKQQEIVAKWKEFRTSFVNKLKDLPKIKVISETAGDLFAEDPSKFWDALLEIGGKRVGIDTHIKGQIDEGSYMEWKTSEPERESYVRQLTWRIQQDNIALTFVVFDEDIWKDRGMIEIARLFGDFNKRNAKSQIIWLSGDAESLAKQIHSMSMKEGVQT